MNLVSIDIETTGLDANKHQVLEVGAVIFNPAEPKEFPTFNILITHPRMDELVTNPYVARLHYDLWKKLDEIRNPNVALILTNGTAVSGNCPAHLLGQTFSKWLDSNGVRGRVWAAGKNFSSFDKVFLEKLPDFKSFVKFGHRALDPTALYTKADDIELPNLDTCCARAGIAKQTDHTALADAQLVAELCMKGLK